MSKVRIVRSIWELSSKPLASELRRSPVSVTVGNFDGLHIGHQALLRELCENSNEGLNVVVSFYPHPRVYFSKEGSQELRLITRLRTRVELMGEIGVDLLCLLRFNEGLSKMSASEFLDRVILDGLQANLLLVGHDWRFGKDREGEIGFLQDWSSKTGVEVREFDALLDDSGLRVSSREIRSRLAEGDVERVAELLGRPYELMGVVVKGAQRGRELGFPTANIEIGRLFIPRPGVYATVLSHRGVEHPAVTNIGYRPTFSDTGLKIETHIIEGDYSLYGERVGLKFISKIRDELKFEDVQALKTQIRADISTAKGILGPESGDKP